MLFIFCYYFVYLIGFDGVLILCTLKIVYPALQSLSKVIKSMVNHNIEMSFSEMVN